MPMTPPVPLSQLAAFSELRVVRDGMIHTLGFLGMVQAGLLAFLEHKRYLRQLGNQDGIAGVITTAELAPQVPERLALALSPAPKREFFRLHNRLSSETGFYGEPYGSQIDPTSDVHPLAHIGPANVRIGPDCRIGPFASILAGSELRRGVVVETGAVVGGAGFQCDVVDGEMTDLIHAGRVVLEEGVCVMANAVIARAVFGDATVIGAESRVGNGAFISHRVRIGRQCLIGHRAVVAGNCILGDRVVIGPGATLSDRLSIGEAAHITLGATVIRDVPAGAKVSGPFATDHMRSMRVLRTKIQ